MKRELNQQEITQWNRQIGRMEQENRKLEKEITILNVNLGMRDDNTDGYAYCIYLDEIARFKKEISTNAEKIKLNNNIIEEGKKQIKDGVEIKEENNGK